MCSAFGMWSTLIIMEVIPFLILAVGVDNLCELSPRPPRADRIPIASSPGSQPECMKCTTCLAMHQMRLSSVIISCRSHEAAQNGALANIAFKIAN